MCGICGVYNFGSDEPADEPALRAMTQVIRHRGPDDQGFHFDRNLGLGMRRLSIIDLAGGKQPIYNENGNVVVVFNGELYNYLELRNRLAQRGHNLATASDTEVLVHLYEDLDVDCLNALRGMFALALWDAPRRRLFLARDRLGIKPLYYTFDDRRLIFGSEIKAILQYPGVEAKLDLEGLSNFLTLKYVPAPQTMFQNVYALRPGWRLTCDAFGLQQASWWDLSFARDDKRQFGEKEYAEQLEALLSESVRMHLMSDVPFGAFLSGGVDSSTIVALMSRYLDQPVKTFSVGFKGDGEEYSELPFARLVAQRYHTDHHEVMVGSHDFVALSEKVIWHLDQPIADEASLANYMVAEMASHYVKMVLTGEGGDELFAGYARYAGERFSPFFRAAPRPLKELALTLAGALPGLRRPKLALRALCESNETARMTNWFVLFNPEMKAGLLSEDVKVQLGDISSTGIFAEALARTDAEDALSRMLYVDTKLWLPDDLLARGDKTSMAASVEARVPLLDHKLVEFAAALPPSLKLRGLSRKYLLKQVSRDLLPTEIVHRKKKGFPIPISVWFRREARPFVRDLLAPAIVKRRGLFNPESVTMLLDEHGSGFADHGSLLWALCSVELWHRLFVDGMANAARAEQPTIINMEIDQPAQG